MANWHGCNQCYPTFDKNLRIMGSDLQQRGIIFYCQRSCNGMKGWKRMFRLKYTRKYFKIVNLKFWTHQMGKFRAKEQKYSVKNHMILAEWRKLPHELLLLCVFLEFYQTLVFFFVSVSQFSWICVSFLWKGESNQEVGSCLNIILNLFIYKVLNIILFFRTQKYHTLIFMEVS